MQTAAWVVGGLLFFIIVLPVTVYLCTVMGIVGYHRGRRRIRQIFKKEDLNGKSGDKARG